MNNRNKQTVEEFFAAAADNDTEKMLSIFDPNIKIVEAESLPYGGIVEGAENFKAFTKRVYTTWRNTSIRVDQLIADDCYVVVLATMFGESKVSGTAFEMEIAEVWTFNESAKVVELKPFYFDTSKLLDLYSGNI